MCHRRSPQHGLTDEQIVGQLRKVKWFKTLPHKDLQSLYQRGRHRFFTRYSTILREGNEGAYFYVLLQGQVRCTSVVNGLNVVLGAGSSFGEGALVTKVRREASVTALEDCYLLQFVAEDVADFAVDLGDVRSHVIALILEKVHFFRTLTHAQRESLSLFMDVEYFTAGMKVFDEGDDGDKFYIVIEGCVNMYKRAAVSGREELVADYATHDERPWFGELALWYRHPRLPSCYVRARASRAGKHHADSAAMNVFCARPGRFARRRCLYLCVLAGTQRSRSVLALPSLPSRPKPLWSILHILPASWTSRRILATCLLLRPVPTRSSTFCGRRMRS